MQIRSTPLLQASLGTQRELQSFHFGAPGPQKVYIQAALHADETPAMLTALHLKRRLQALEAQGALAAEIVLVPMANPIGLAQGVLGQFLGRFDLHSGKNFNRDFLQFDLAGIEPRLGSDAQQNKRLIQSALHAWLAGQTAPTEYEALRLALLQLSCDADLVLDLHCSLEAVMHVYTSEADWPQVEPLSRYLGAEASLLASDSGGSSFDETHSLFWLRLMNDIGQRHPIAPGCTAVTVECRGQRDVSDEFAHRDAEAIIDFLTLRGAIQGPARPLPALPAPATPLAGSEQFNAPVSGILLHRVPLGARVAKGDLLFDIVDPLTDRTTSVRSGTDGVLYMRRAIRFVRSGDPIGRVTGAVARRVGVLIGH
jgi:predicted deacylase